MPWLHQEERGFILLLIKFAVVALLALLVIQLVLQIGSSFVLVLPIVLGIWIFLILQNQKTDTDEENDDS
jgi:fatty acid desaturase